MCWSCLIMLTLKWCLELFQYNRAMVAQIVWSVLKSHLYSYNQEQEHDKHCHIKKVRRWRCSLSQSPSIVGNTGLSHSWITHVKCNNALEWITVCIDRRGFIFLTPLGASVFLCLPCAGPKFEFSPVLVPDGDGSLLPCHLSSTWLLAAVCTSYYLNPINV